MFDCERKARSEPLVPPKLRSFRPFVHVRVCVRVANTPPAVPRHLPGPRDRPTVPRVPLSPPLPRSDSGHHQQIPHHSLLHHHELHHHLPHRALPANLSRVNEPRRVPGRHCHGVCQGFADAAAQRCERDCRERGLFAELVAGEEHESRSSGGRVISAL